MNRENSLRTSGVREVGLRPVVLVVPHGHVGEPHEQATGAELCTCEALLQPDDGDLLEQLEDAGAKWLASGFSGVRVIAVPDSVLLQKISSLGKLPLLRIDVRAATSGSVLRVASSGYSIAQLQEMVPSARHYVLPHCDGVADAAKAGFTAAAVLLASLVPTLGNADRDTGLSLLRTGEAYRAAKHAVSSWLEDCAQVDRPLNSSSSDVGNFAEKWLKHHFTEQALLTALLEEWWVTEPGPLGEPDARQIDLTDDTEVVKEIERRARRAQAALKPLFARHINHVPIGSLADPVGENGSTAEDLLADRRSPEQLVIGEPTHYADHPCIGPVLDELTADELQVARAFAVLAVPWQQAALLVGAPVTVGERVRRKLKRLGARHQERARASRSQTIDAIAPEPDPTAPGCPTHLGRPTRNVAEGPAE